jgi:hypothetical protein
MCYQSLLRLILSLGKHIFFFEIDRQIFEKYIIQTWSSAKRTVEKFRIKNVGRKTNAVVHACGIPNEGMKVAMLGRVLLRLATIRFNQILYLSLVTPCDLSTYLIN